MPRLDNISRKGLSPDDLRQYPVWVWDDATEAVCPLSQPETDADDYATLFIRASLTGAQGDRFDGYLIGDGEAFYAFGVFVAGRKHVFNVNLPDFAEAETRVIADRLGNAAFRLLPIRYVSDVELKKGALIAGTLDVGTGV